MALGLDNYSSNEVIDAIKDGDKSVSIIGFIEDIDSVGSKLHKLTVNNGRGRRVQIVARDENVSTIGDIDQLNAIVFGRNLIASRRSADNSRNEDGVELELLCHENSYVQTYGIHGGYRKVLQTSISDAVCHMGVRIRIEGYVKSDFVKHRYGKLKFFRGSITDGLFQLDLKIATEASKIDLRIGQPVAVVGMMSCNSWLPPGLCVNGLHSIVPLDKDDLPMEEVLCGNTYPKRDDRIIEQVASMDGDFAR